MNYLPSQKITIHITLTSKVFDLIEVEPFLLEGLIRIHPGFARLRKPAFRVGPDHALPIFQEENDANRELLARLEDLLDALSAPACPSARGEASPSACDSCSTPPGGR